MQPIFRAFILATSLFVTSPLPALSQEQPHAGTISLQGQGIVTAEPDLAFINSGVTNQGNTAREALTANTESMGSLIKVLKAADVEEKDIQTSNFSVQPQYNYSTRGENNRPPKISGYIVSNQVSVRIRDIADVGKVLDQMVTVGANTINNVSFSVDDSKPLYTEARKRAIADAIEKAKLYTGEAGVELGRILNISENGGFQPQPQQMAGRMASMEMDSAPVPIQAGELTYNIFVSVQWELDQ